VITEVPGARLFYVPADPPHTIPAKIRQFTELTVLQSLCELGGTTASFVVKSFLLAFPHNGRTKISCATQKHFLPREKVFHRFSFAIHSQSRTLIDARRSSPQNASRTSAQGTQPPQ
jgi:hypothetical protein